MDENFLKVAENPLKVAENPLNIVEPEKQRALLPSLG